MAEEEKDGVVNKLAEEGKNIVKQKVKSVAKKFIITALPYIVGFLIVLLIASMAWAVFNYFQDKINEIGQTVMNGLKSIGQSIINFFTGNDDELKISDEMLDSIINTIEDNGVDLEDLNLLRRN